MVVPLVTATIGWAAAAATARLRLPATASAFSVPVTAAGPAGAASRHPVSAPREAGPAVPVSNWRRTAWLLLLCVIGVAAVAMAVATGLRG